MFQHPRICRHCSRWLLLALLLSLPATAPLFADDTVLDKPTPVLEEVHPWDADELGFHLPLPRAVATVWQWLQRLM